MKSIYKILIMSFLLIAPRLYAREIVLIENRATTQEGELLKMILMTKFHLPHELITLINTPSPCDFKSDAIIHLCLEANGELNIVKMNQYVVKNSLGIFLNQTEEKGDIQ